jgi:acetyl esterase/lipase
MTLSLRARATRAVLPWVLKPVLNRIENPIELQRKQLERLSPWFVRQPKDTRITQKNLGGVACEWVVNGRAGANMFVLYLHGGGFVKGSAATHRSITSHLARDLGACVVVPEYRLAPEHPFPAALEDCMAAYRGLLAQDIPAHRIVVAGDSAGGNLAIVLSLKLKEMRLEQPSCLVLMAPACDMKSTRALMKDPVNDPVLALKWLHQVSDDYAHNLPLHLPLISPVYADLHGLPPMLLQVGGRDLLVDGCRRFAEKAKASGVDIVYQEEAGLWHVWHLLLGLVPEAAISLKEIAAFVGRIQRKTA